MIGRITGQLAEKNPPEVLVDCGGVGYELLVPMSTFYNLPALGEPVSLLTHFVVREDAQILFGFGTPAERLLLELKGKLGPDLGPAAAAPSDAHADIGQALLALGYSDKEAALALKALPADVSVSDGIKLALKALAR